MTIGCFPFSHNSSLTTKQPTNQVKNFLLGLTLNVLGHYDHINSDKSKYWRSTAARNEMSARLNSTGGGIGTREEAKLPLQNETKRIKELQSRTIKKSRIAKQNKMKS